MAKARHRKPSKTKRTVQRAAVVTTGTALAAGSTLFIPTDALAQPASAWDALIRCESGGQNILNSSGGSTASGYFQITNGTWDSAGGDDKYGVTRAMDASFEAQADIAFQIASNRGSLADWNASRACWGDEISDEVPDGPAALPAFVPPPVPPAPVEVAPAPVPEVVSVPGWQRILDAAKPYYGTPYVWGGEDKSGMDCSGFVMRVFADLGIELPRNSAAQASAGAAVGSIAEAQAGDLLFFDTDHDGVINHVAIYLGNNRMVDSGNTGDVVREKDVWATPSAIRRVEVPGLNTPTPAASEQPAPVEGEQYTVQPGDWLSKIAPRFGVTWQEIYEDNKEVIGDNPNLIYPGQVYYVGGLRLPNPPVTVDEGAREEEVVPATPEQVEQSVPVPNPVAVEAIIVNSAGPVSPRVQAAANAVFTNVRGASLITLGGTRSSARDPNGHPSGNALDYMVLSDAALGDAIVNYHVQHWDELGVEYIIWQQRILLSPNGTWDLMEDRGSPTQNHMDHVHVNYNP